jgi:hypothetical protein
MKVIALLALAGSAAAFAPAQQSRASTSLAAFENELGVQAPVSGKDLQHENNIQTSLFDVIETNLHAALLQ